MIRRFCCAWVLAAVSLMTLAGVPVRGQDSAERDAARAAVAGSEDAAVKTLKRVRLKKVFLDNVSPSEAVAFLNAKIKQAARGFMIESYIEDGRQDQPEVYGKSIIFCLDS